MLKKKLTGLYTVNNNFLEINSAVVFY